VPLEREVNARHLVVFCVPDTGRLSAAILVGRVTVVPPATTIGSSQAIITVGPAVVVDGHRKLPTGGHLWRILWPWFLPAYGQIVPHLL